MAQLHWDLAAKGQQQGANSCEIQLGVLKLIVACSEKDPDSNPTSLELSHEFDLIEFPSQHNPGDFAEDRKFVPIDPARLRKLLDERRRGNGTSSRENIAS